MTREQFIDHFAATWLATRAALERNGCGTAGFPHNVLGGFSVQEAERLAETAWRAWSGLQVGPHGCEATHGSGATADAETEGRP